MTRVGLAAPPAHRRAALAPPGLVGILMQPLQTRHRRASSTRDSATSLPPRPRPGSALPPRCCLNQASRSAAGPPPARPAARRGVLRSSQPAAALEERDGRDEHDDHDAYDGEEAGVRPLAGHVRVHAPDRGYERQRQDDDADRGEDAEGVVQAVREDRLVGRLERLDDLLVVLEHVPGALGRVVDVVEVDLEVVGDVALGRLEVLEGRALRAHHAAEVDDLLLDIGDVAHDLRRALALEDVVLEALELVAHLAQHRERRVDAVVDDLVEQVARALGEQLLAQVLARAAALEEVLERLDGLVGQRDDVVGPDEDVELGRVQAPDRLVVGREVQDYEQVVVVLVDLGALVAAEDVLVVERVEVEVLFQPGAVCGPGALDVDPAQRLAVAGGELDDLDVGTLRLGWTCGNAAACPRRTPQAWLGQVGHWDFAARRASWSSASDSLRKAVYLRLASPRGLAKVSAT